jgi:hypothetical protein
VLDEANIGALLTETLTTDVETVFSDQTSSMCADTAVEDLISLHSVCMHRQLLFMFGYPLRYFMEGSLTIRESPFHRCAGASTRRTRETCWVVAICDLRICRTIWKSSLVAEIDGSVADSEVLTSRSDGRGGSYECLAMMFTLSADSQKNI